MLKIHFSNHYESLLETLLTQFAGSRGDPFVREQIIVPSAAHRRALTLAIANREGVCANIEFPFLAQWLWQLAGRLLPIGDQSPFDASSLTWRVYEALRDSSFVADFPRLCGYLASVGADEVVRHELAANVAALLDQYGTYRPEWLPRWQKQVWAEAKELGPDEAWQAALWRRIADRLGLAPTHPLELLIQKLAESGDAGADLAHSSDIPKRVHVFSVTAVPPLYLAALKALGQWVHVQIYVLNPSRDYWHDLVSPAEKARRDAQGQEGFEVGHRLLASWGRQTQSLLALLLEQAEGQDVQTEDHFKELNSDCLLHALQTSMLDLEDIAPGSLAPLPEDDRSVEVHVCHSLTRQLEVLQNYLLGLFVDNAHLQPSEILVVMPDLQSAAPLIDAVFGSAPTALRIPYEITGLGRAAANRPAQAFSALFTLAASRCTVTQVQGVLQQEPVARRFGLDATDLEKVHEWLQASGVHWGLDEDQLRGEELPAARHTLAAGVERLFLAYALPDGTQEIVNGLLPTGDVEGSDALPLGALDAFLGALQELRREVFQSRTPAGWRSFLHETADRFLEAGDGELEELLALHATFDELVDGMERAGLEQAVPSPAVRKALEGLLEDPARGGVPTGRVTFTGLGVLRGLPYEVICAIGMDDGAYPTASRPAEFDLMRGNTRLGDRQRGPDQRNGFLDLLLSARSRFYVSYTGRSIRDNAVLPPSVLVSELLDVIVPAIASAEGGHSAIKAARRRLVVEHPLQPFSPDCFTEAEGQDPRLRSFDEELARALRVNAAKPVAERTTPEQEQDAEVPEGDDEATDDEEVDVLAYPFFTASLPAPSPEWRDVSLSQLIEFYRGPSRYLLRRRMGLDLPYDEKDLVDEESFVPNILARSALAERMLPLLLQGADAALALQLAQAGTEFPEGALGAEELQAEMNALTLFAKTVARHTEDPVLAPRQHKFSMQIEDETWTLHGGFSDLRPKGRVRWRFDDERAGDVVGGWIEHLFLCAQSPIGVELRTTGIGRQDARVFTPLDLRNAQAKLAELIKLYRHGLRSPLRFFPKASWAFIEKDSLTKALNVWKGGPNASGENSSNGHSLAFRGDPAPLAGDFEVVAKTVLGDVLDRSQVEVLVGEVQA